MFSLLFSFRCSLELSPTFAKGFLYSSTGPTELTNSFSCPLQWLINLHLKHWHEVLELIETDLSWTGNVYWMNRELCDFKFMAFYNAEAIKHFTDILLGPCCVINQPITGVGKHIWWSALCFMASTRTGRPNVSRMCIAGNWWDAYRTDNEMITNEQFVVVLSDVDVRKRMNRCKETQLNCLWGWMMNRYTYSRSVRVTCHSK
jgi:hypothetical protein